MFKRITALALCLVLAVSLLPAASAFRREPIAPESADQCCHTLRVDTLDPNYVRPAYEGKLIDITQQRVEDHFNYLEDVYIDRYPEAALLVNTGDDRDREDLKTLAETITQGCATDTEKANAIDRWLFRNIVYDVNTSAYASDTFYDRTGNCLSYANLMQFLLRSLGIPAVVGDGWRGDMKTATVDLFNYEGHAWCFVYLEGQWVLYDPLWIDCGTTDRDYIAEWIYLDTVEFVTPAYDGDNLPPEAYNKPKVYYTDGVWYNYNDGAEMGYGNFTQYVNNQGYNFTTNQDEPENGISDGWYYLDGVSDKTQMKRGEIYRNSWISYGDYRTGEHIKLTYAHANGMQIDGAVMEYDGKKLYMVRNGCYPILADEEDYRITYGTMTFKPGYTGPFIGKYWGSYYDTPDHFVIWESQNPEIATVDENGILTAVAPGWATIKIQLIREDVWQGQVDYAYLSTSYVDILISDEERVPDYSDQAPCEHNYELNGYVSATCTMWGYEIHICTLCGARTEVHNQEPLGHSYIATVQTEPGCTEPGVACYTCERCGDSYTAADLEPVGHSYTAMVLTEPTCTEWGVTRYTCQRCGDSYDQTDIAPVAHSYTASVLTEPTCTEWGVTCYTCACGDSYDETDIEPLGHDWDGTECTRCDATRPTPFTDVAEGSFYEMAVSWAVSNGITNGISTTEFGPTATCDRAQVVTFLWRAAGEPEPAAGMPEPTATGNPFVDVVPGSFYEKAVLWAMEKGITNGTDATHFGPGAPCNRASVVTFLWRAAGKPTPNTAQHPFTDVPAGSWYEAPILWALENGITNGISATEFGSTGACIRAQVVTFLYRAFAE